VIVQILVALALIAVLQQGDLASWIEKLGDESIEVRERASRHLMGLKPSEIGSLQKALEAARDPEIRARLAQILDHHRKTAELAKVFGPALRYSKSGKGLELEDVMRDLAALAGPSMDFESVDPSKRIDIDLANVTWWEAMDRCAAAAGLRYSIGKAREGKRRLTWAPARGSEGPVLYMEQFKISVLDVRRFELRTPGGRSEVGHVTVGVLHQPGMKSVRPGLSESIHVFVKNAKGEDVNAAEPECEEGMSYYSNYDLAHYGHCWVQADAPGPLTVLGTASIQFAKDPQAVTIDLDGLTGECKKGPVKFWITGFTQSKAQSKLTVKARSDETTELFERMVESSVVVVDAEGGHHAGDMCFSGRNWEDITEWEFKFRGPIKDPKKVEFRWIAEFHTVELPYRLEGVRLP
jgi:hypothetical protein